MLLGGWIRLRPIYFKNQKPFMKPRPSLFRNSIAGAIIIAATFSFATHAQAAGGDWNVDADGFWNTPSNWNPAAVPGTTAGDVVNLTYDITTTGKTITIDTAVRLGTLNIGDPDGSHLYTLALSSGSLKFDNGASAAQLNKTPGFNAATISAPASLDSDLAVSNVTNGNLNLNGVISNGVNGAKSVTITNTGNGITTLSGANTFSGGLTVKQGTVSGTTSPQAFGGAGILLGDTSGSANATLRGDNRTFANPITVQSGSSGNTLTLLGVGGTNTTTFSGGITLNRDLTLDSSSGTLIINTNAITGSGTLSIANSSATPNVRNHRVAINVANPDFTGGVDILTGGSLRVGAVTGVGVALTVANTVKVRSGGLLDLNANPTIAGLNDEGGSGGLVSPISDPRTLAVGGSGTYSFNGNIEDYLQVATLRVLSLVKSGAGTQALGGTNAYTGTTTLNGGVLKLNSANALPGGIGATGGTSALLFGNGIGGVIGLTAASGDFTRAIQGLTPAADKVGWVNGGIGGFAAFGGDRLVNFGGAAGAITWAPPSGILGATFILGHSSADSKVTVVNPIDLGGFPRTVLVHDGSAAVDGEFSGVISGGGELNKTGTGTLDLTGNNTYGAATHVLEGTLRIKGLHTGTNNSVTVSSGATLIMEASGQLSFAPTTNGTSNKITGAGSVTLNGTLFFKLGGADLTNGNSWTIVDAAGVTSNLAGVASFPALTWNESPSGVWKAMDGSNTWTYSESSGRLELAVTAGATYESWAINNGISGAAFTDDADNDGINNGIEYAIGGNPTAFTAPAALIPAGADFTLTYPKGAEAAVDSKIGYAFEISADLGSWTEVAPTTEDGSSVSYTLVKDGPKRFVRLKIKRLP
jgi:autotransporter-associated beta strand protein